MQKRGKAILIFSILSLLTGCGSNDGNGNHSSTNPNSGNDNTNQPITYNLKAYETSTISMNIQGTYINDTVTGSSFTHTTDTQNQNGLTIDVKERVLSLDGNIPNNDKVTKSYFGYSQGGLYFVKADQATCTLPNTASPTPLPTQVQPGYQSDTIRLDCDDGWTMEVQYRLEKANENNAEYSISYKRFLEGAGANYVVTTFSDTYIVTPEMDIIAYQYQYSSGPVTINLEATTIAVY
jgi:major membrane immunogen (membrane-anchored lipoprotein)